MKIERELTSRRRIDAIYPEKGRKNIKMTPERIAAIAQQQNTNKHLAAFSTRYQDKYDWSDENLNREPVSRIIKVASEKNASLAYITIVTFMTCLLAILACVLTFSENTMLNEKIGTLSVSVKILGWAAFLILLIWAIILWEKRSYGYYCDYFINCISLLETICNKKLEDWPENFDYQEKVIAFLTQKANEVKKAQQEESARPWKENTSDRLRDQFAENHRKIFVLVDIPKDHGPYYDEVDEAEKK